MNKDQWIADRAEAYELSGMDNREALSAACADWYEMTDTQDY